MLPDYSTARDRHFQHSMRQLRDRAEKRRERLAVVVLPDGAPQMQYLIQELQTHQIELELQYEELLTMQAETERLRARYTDLFEFAPVGYISLDVLGIVKDMNRQGAILLGTTRHRLTNRRFLQFVAPASRDAFLRLMVDVLAAEDSVTAELDLLRDDNTPLRVRLDGIALPDPEGTRLCRFSLTDLTPEYRATAEREQGEARFQTYLDHSPDGMLLLRHHHVVACNAAARQLLGATDEQQLTGRHIAMFAPPTQPDGRASLTVAEEYLAAALRDGYARFEWCSRRLDTQADAWQEVTLTALSTDGPALVLATWRDLSKRNAPSSLPS